MVNNIVATIVPLLITIIILAVLAVVAWVGYQVATDVADKTTKKMESKNMSFSKDGLKVGVKDKSAEQVGDSTQRHVLQRSQVIRLLTPSRGIMKAWNASEWPAYESKLGWAQSNSARSPASPGTGPRKV